MKTRYRHIMAPTKGDKHPDLVIGLACDTHRESVKGRSGAERILLDRWYVSGVSALPSPRSSSFDSTGTAVAGFWHLIERQAKKHKHVLIISQMAVTGWALLELWEALENDRVRIVGRDKAGGDRAAKGAARDGRGFIVSEDPPSILYCYVAGNGPLLRWVDARNYGIGSSGQERPGHDRAVALCQFATKMTVELTSRGLGGLRDTSAAQSLYSFRRKHLQHCICCHTVASVLELEQQAYYSGRCECGRIGYVEGPVYELDVRGSYLYCCANVDVPIRLRSYRLSTASGEMPDFGTGRGLIGDISVETDAPDYPYRLGPITVFPAGLMRTTLCGPELQDAIDRGRVRKWHAWAEYDLAPALASYAAEIYDLRCQAESAGNELIARWAKSLAVSLIGKLGQRGRNWIWETDRKPRYYYDQYYGRHTDGRVYRYQEIAGYHRRESLTGWAPESVPAISAWICSAARMRLLEMIRCAGFAECYYRDTDSLFVTDVGYRKLCAAGWVRIKELGYLQLKGVHEWMEISGLKSYRTPALHRMGGTSGSGLAPVLDAAAHRQSVWLSTYLQMGSRPDSLSVAIPRERLQPYRHGNVTVGGRVEPLHVWED